MATDHSGGEYSPGEWIPNLRYAPSRVGTFYGLHLANARQILVGLEEILLDIDVALGNLLDVEVYGIVVVSFFNSMQELIFNHYFCPEDQGIEV